MVLVVQKAHKGLRVRKVLMVSKATRVPKETRDKPVRKGTQEKRVKKAI